MAQTVANAPAVARPVAVLRVVRVARGYTQRRLAAEAGLARPTISRLEAGQAEPQSRTAHRLAAVLEFPVEDLFPAVNEPRPAGGPSADATSTAGRGRRVPAG